MPDDMIVHGAPEADAPEAEKTEVPAAIENDSSAETEAESETAEDEQEEKPKPRGGFQRRIDKLTAAKSAAEQRANDLERQLAERSAGQPKETPLPAGAPVKPVAADFDTYEAYVEKLADWKFEVRDLQRTAAEAQRKAAESQKAIQETWQERVTKARERYEDFDDVIDAVDQPISQAMHETIIESEAGAEIAYHLAKHPAEAARIAKLSPFAAARELGKIEATLTASATPVPTTKPKLSNAPAPLKPVGAKSSTSTKEIDAMSYEEYKAYRAKH